MLATLLVLYVLSIILSFCYILQEYRRALKGDFEYEWHETFIALVICPLIPIFNVFLIYAIVFDK